MSFFDEAQVPQTWDQLQQEYEIGQRVALGSPFDDVPSSWPGGVWRAPGRTMAPRGPGSDLFVWIAALAFVAFGGVA